MTRLEKRAVLNLRVAEGVMLLWITALLLGRFDVPVPHTLQEITLLAAFLASVYMCTAAPLAMDQGCAARAHEPGGAGEKRAQRNAVLIATGMSIMVAFALAVFMELRGGIPLTTLSLWMLLVPSTAVVTHTSCIMLRPGRARATEEED